MWEDPIVAEVHRAREELAAKFGYDVNAVFADIQKRQAALGPRLVSPKKQGETLRSPSGDDQEKQVRHAIEEVQK